MCRLALVWKLEISKKYGLASKPGYNPVEILWLLVE
jgi:hypothetical protein